MGVLLDAVRTMPFYACLVSWPQLVARWKAHVAERSAHAKDADWNDANRQADLLFDARDRGEPWVAGVDLWTDSHNTSMCMSRVYEKLRRYLPAAARKKHDRLFGAFFWLDEAGRCAIAFVQELSDYADPEVFAAAMRPGTVRAHLALWDQAAFEQLRQPFRSEFPEGAERVEEFETFSRFVGMWVDLLREAAKQRRGLVVSWF
jgi:hypothetical protein